MSVYDAESRGRRVAERAAEAWYSYQGTSDSDIAVGVVAALALTARADPAGPDPAKILIGSSDDEIVQMLAEVWSMFWISRPDLARLVGPFAGWLNDDDPSPSRVKAAAHVARAAAKAGLLDMAHNGTLLDTDVIGTTYLNMRSDSGRQARGEFYTPPNLCDMMAAMTLGSDLKPGMSIAEPAAGHGGMLRAAANHIRQRGMNPGDFWWVVNDISPVVVAGLAVNCHVWDLGPRIVIGVADTLREPDWPERAWREQQEVTAQRDEQMRLARSLAMFRRVLSGDWSEEPPASPTVLEECPPAPPVPPVPPFDPSAPMIQLSLFDEEPAA
jgi:N-6 DNA Methylase